MDPDPLRLLETAHPVRSPALLPSSPNSRFRLRQNCRLTHTPETVNKRVNKIEKNVDGPTQMSRRRRPSRFPLPSENAVAWPPSLANFSQSKPLLPAAVKDRERQRLEDTRNPLLHYDDFFFDLVTFDGRAQPVQRLLRGLETQSE